MRWFARDQSDVPGPPVRNFTTGASSGISVIFVCFHYPLPLISSYCCCVVYPAALAADAAAPKRESAAAQKVDKVDNLFLCCMKVDS